MFHRDNSEGHCFGTQSSKEDNDELFGDQRFYNCIKWFQPKLSSSVNKPSLTGFPEDDCNECSKNANLLDFVIASFGRLTV